MADPEYLPAMCPLIQKVCKDFPYVASNIVVHSGLPIEEFNTLQDKLQSNMFFRFQIQKEIEKYARHAPSLPPLITAGTHSLPTMHSSPSATTTTTSSSSL